MAKIKKKIILMLHQTDFKVKKLHNDFQFFSVVYRFNQWTNYNGTH